MILDQVAAGYQASCGGKEERDFFRRSKKRRTEHGKKYRISV